MTSHAIQVVRMQRLQVPNVPVPFSVSICNVDLLVLSLIIDCRIDPFLLYFQVSYLIDHVANSKIATTICSVLLTSDFDLWIPSFLFTHVVVILIGLWAAQDRKVLEPIIAYIVAVAISILMDIIQLGVYFADAQDRANGDSDREIGEWALKLKQPCSFSK